jgi:TIR domain
MSLEPIGFWSYTRDDDARSRGRLSQLRTLLADELQGRLGRAERVQIFQDVAGIPYGAAWENELDTALECCSFFIPILTPGFLQSEMCCREIMRFRQREITLWRNDLIFPIHYIDVDEVQPDRPGSVFDRAAWDCLRSRQQIDFRHLRLQPPENNVDVAAPLRNRPGATSRRPRAITPTSPMPP